MAEPTAVAQQTISFSTAIPLAIAAVVLIVIAVFLIGRLKKVLENTVLGVIALIAINFLGSGLGVSIPINVLTVLASAVFGLAGIGALILLSLLGIKL